MIHDIEVFVLPSFFHFFSSLYGVHHFVEDTFRIRISTNYLRVNKLYIFQSILIINDNLYGDCTRNYYFRASL